MTTAFGGIVVAAIVVWWLAAQSVLAIAFQLHHVQIVISALIGGN